VGHLSEDADARRRFLKKLIPKILSEQRRVMTLAKLTAHINFITCPSGYISRRSKEFFVSKPEVESVANELAGLGVVEKITERRKRDPKKDWPKRYRIGNLLLQLACAALEDDERQRLLG
jgi:hypothetical protein